jgi:hypothetical protein
MPNTLFRYSLIFLAACAAWSLTIGSHELIGHGGVCAIDPNCAWLYADGMYFHRALSAGAWTNWITAGGSLLNIATALGALICLHAGLGRAFALRVFLWSLIAACLIVSGSYIGFGQFIHPGMDWARLQVANDWSAMALVAVGLAIVGFGVQVSAHHLPRLGQTAGQRAATLLMVMLGFSLTSLLVGFVIPTDDRAMMIWGGVGNGTFFMAWLVLALIPIWGRPAPPASDRPLAWSDSLYLIPFVVLSALYVLVLTPGISFSD